MHLQLDQLTGREAVRVLSHEIERNMRETGSTLKAIARKANLGDKTVANIFNRVTFEPRFSTSLALFKALGYVAMRLERAVVEVGPIDGPAMVFGKPGRGRTFAGPKDAKVIPMVKP